MSSLTVTNGWARANARGLHERAGAFICVVLFSLSFGAAHAKPPPRETLIDDSFTQELAGRYETTGDAQVSDGLLLGPRSAIAKQLSGESAATLTVDLAENERIDAEWKLQLTLRFEGSHSVSAQLVTSKEGSRLLVFEVLGEDRNPGTFREFQVTSPVTGTWSLGFHLGHVTVSFNGVRVGEAAVTPSDSQITGAFVASIRGRSRVSRLRIDCQQTARTLTSDEIRLLAQADANQTRAQNDALFSRYLAAANAMALAVAGYERVLGEGAFRTIWARGALVALYFSHLGRYSQARLLLEKALNDFTELLGRDHPYTATAQLMLANLLIGINDAQQGMPLAESALRTAIRVYGDRSPTVAAPLSSYAAAFAALGNYSAAADALAAAVKIREDEFGSEDSHSVRYLIQLADLQARAGRADAARESLQRALQIFLSPTNANPEGELRVRRSLATIDLDAGNYLEAANTLRALLPKVKNQFGQSHRNVALVLHDLSIALLAQGDIDEARHAIDEAATILLGEAMDVIGASSEQKALHS